MLELQSNGDLTVTFPAELIEHLDTAYGEYVAAVHEEKHGRPARALRRRAHAQHTLAQRIHALTRHAGHHLAVLEVFMAASFWYEARSNANYRDASELDRGGAA